MKGLVENDCGHDPGQPNGNRHGHQTSDVLGLPIVVSEMKPKLCDPAQLLSQGLTQLSPSVGRLVHNLTCSVAT